MDCWIPIHASEDVPKDTMFLLPKVRAMVYLAPGQREATFQQEMAAMTEAYVQAAKRGEVGVIRNREYLV